MKLHRGNKKLSQDQNTLSTQHRQLKSSTKLNIKLSLGLSKTSWALALIILSSAFFVSSVNSEDSVPKIQYNVDTGIDNLSEIIAQMPDSLVSSFDSDKKTALLSKYGNNPFVIEVDSIEPEGGPTTGNTRVLVRGGPFTDLIYLFPKPKCKFGKNDMTVDATYVTCTTSPTAIEATEARRAQRNSTCLQCDNSPEYDSAEIIPFSVSLIGDFSDSINSLPYRYYKPVIYSLPQFYSQTRVWAIYPKQGPKDGSTFVQVWGENFLNFDENTRCNFGSKSVIAHYVSNTYMTCISPFSDVVEAAIPFSISLNKQQNSLDSISYWYYNWPSIVELQPNYGPDSGGNTVLVKGNNFNPFIGMNIDISNDTFCEFEGIAKVKATVINSTKLTCVAPPNYVLDQTLVELTLNNQQYTDDEIPYYYYRPPQVFDIDPREGPTKGGTEVTVYGNKFKQGKNITCKFGEKITRGTFIDTNRILCVSPAVERPGYVTLTISYEGEKYSSESVKYLYYDTPEVYNITPTCGPVQGYTQITLNGKNFIDMGFGKAKCIFNNTYVMNATVMEMDIIKCDSPQLPAHWGYADNFYGAPYVNISITINGKDIYTTTQRFNYYIDPVIKSITPNSGPLRGGTVSWIHGDLFNQEGICNVTVRYGVIQQFINTTNNQTFNETDIMVVSPPANVPDSVVVSISLNGQQFIRDIIYHHRDIENTFTYIQEMLIQEYSPKAGPTSGKTKIKVKGMGFAQFKNDDGTTAKKPIWVRFRDAETNQTIGQPTEAFDITDDEFSWFTPPADSETKAILEISYNQYDWQSITIEGKNYSYQYYNAPHISGISPSYGPVKSPNNETIEITGTNFNCPDTECKDLWVRFGDPENGILVKGEKDGDNKIKCSVPKYTKPDVLPVEVTFNGQDFTHDNNTYGFFDPFVLDVQPRLISTKGTTKVRLYGFGFVNASTDLKTKLNHITRGNLTCSGSYCIQSAEYIDKSTIESPTYAQKSVYFTDNNDNIEKNGMVIEASVSANSYTENKIEIWYYEEPVYEYLNVNGTATNQEKPIFISTDFKWDTNDLDKFRKHGNITCRFTSTDGKTVMYATGKMENYPIGMHEDNDYPSHIRCQSPNWKNNETVKLDISINGQDYSGNFDFIFYEKLDLYRIAPMCGPLSGKTRVKLIGSGFNASKEDVYIRWGILETEMMTKDLVLEYIWNENEFVFKTMVDGSENLIAYKKETWKIQKKDYELVDGDRLKTVVGHSPRPFNHNRTHGGPIYMAVGSHMVLNTTCQNCTSEDDSTQNLTYINKTLYSYSHSFVEFYYYIQPVVKKVEPKTGLTRGGTRIEVSGAWFEYRPEYGVVPHCKIGDKVIRGKWFSTVRITCNAPPNEDINQLYPVTVSLNGVDFVDAGFTFRYYEAPVLYKMTPICGPESGGTQIYISGSKFSNITDPSNFNCKFTSLDRDIPAKFIPAFYENQTTIMCSSPGGWGRGDSVRVQVTFNGEDYSDNNFTFYYYNILRAYPRSGPADGSGGPIRIEGSGFRNDTAIYCSLDKVLYEPLEVAEDVIKCPMVKSAKGNNYFGNVEFAVVIDGNWHKFTGGFQYYEQVALEDMYPHIGPSEGKGVLLMYGKNFRDDFQLADVGCKIGDSIGKGKVVNSNTINCTVEEMSLVDEGFSLPVSVALNSYSWPETNQTFIPYGVTGIYPNSGPYSGSTDILVTGKGFFEEYQTKAKCRFGISSNYAIVDAEILGYDKLICRSPAEFKLPVTADQTISVPFGISFLEEDFEPWTESLHRFRFYQQPTLSRADPDEVEVGKLAEVYVFADENSEFFERKFNCSFIIFLAIPTSKGSVGQYGIECKFGRFGSGVGMYVNKTTIKCVTPSVSDDPDSIWRETVKLTVAMNGQDYDDESSDVDFTFVGTGSTLVFWPYVIGTLLIGLLLVALIMFCSAMLQNFSFQRVMKQQQQRNNMRQKNKPFVIRDPYDQFTSRAYNAGMQGRLSVRDGSQ